MSASAINMEKMSTRRRFDSSGGRTVMPEPANNKSYMESVFNFIHDLSQAYSHSTPVEEKEPIVWASYFSYSDAFGYEDLEETNAPLLLVLGYPNGMQMWNLLANGEAQEMFSLREGPVKTACLLPPPPPSDEIDELQEHRPLMAICLANDSKQLFTSVSIQSLRTGEQIKRLQFPSDVISMQAGPAPLLLVMLKNSIHAFNSRTMECSFVVNGCYSSYTNPVSLGKRWLVYSPTTSLSNLQSAGGITGDGAQSYVTSVLNAAKTIGKGISTFSDTVNWLAAKSHLTSSMDESSSSSSVTSRDRSWAARRSMSANGVGERCGDNAVAGLVTILDVTNILENLKQDDSGRRVAVEIDCEPDRQWVVSHFIAHVGQAVACLQLASSGRLLATADVLGHAFHVFSILPHPGGSSLAAVHHLYTLWRGETLAQVQELRFSCDSRWLSASTLRGTCHIFPVAPYGGSPNVRTHTSDRVVNRSSRFHKSAGLDEIEYAEAQPAPTHRPLSDSPTPLSQGVLGWQTHHRILTPRSLASYNPRLPPLPHPVNVHALAHIRLGPSTTTSLPGVLPTQASFMTSSTDATMTSQPKNADVVIATRFMYSSRNESSGSTSSSGSKSSAGGAQRLLIASSSGYLTEYLLEPRPQHGLPKVSDDSPVELVATPRVCWPLQRQASWNIVSLILTRRNPLVLADDVCRRHYELASCRQMVKSHNKTVQNCSSVPVVPLGKQNIRSEQPKSRAKPRSSSPRAAYPGTAVPRSEKTKSRKTMSLTNPSNQSPPTSAIMERNGHRSSDDETRVSSSGEDIDLKPPAKNPKSKISEEWLSQVEMITHEGPARRLWMGPQFHFKHLLSTGNTHVLSSVSSALLSNQQHQVDTFSANGYSQGGAHGEDMYEEELDVRSLTIHSVRSEPVPTPAPRCNSCLDDSDVSVGCCAGVTIEAGSGNFDRSAHMLEINAYGSLEDRRHSGFGVKGCEDKLKERIADAMLDLNGDVSTKTMSSSPPFASSGSPNFSILRTKSDATDYGSLPLVSEHFDFSNAGAPSIQLPADE